MNLLKYIVKLIKDHRLIPYFIIRDMSNPIENIDSRAKNMNDSERGPSAGEIGIKITF